MTLLRSICPKFGNQEFPILTDSVLLGRSADCDIHLDHGGVSRRHAKIMLLSSGYFIEDLQSSNGTRVNDNLIEETVRLFDGDRISICDLEFVFVCEKPSSQRSAAGIVKKRYDAALLEDEPTNRRLNVTSQISLADNTIISRPTSLRPDDYAHHIQVLQTKLDVMLQMMKNLGKVVKLRELLPSLLENLLRLFPQADFTCYVAPNSVSGQLELIDFISKTPPSGVPFKISRLIPQRVFETRTAILSDDIQDDDRFNPTDSLLHSRICSIMAVPVIAQSSGAVVGVIQIDSRNSGCPFNDIDLDLLVSIASQIAVYQENLYYQDVKHNEEMMSQEMSVAHKVQRGFLPYRRPEVTAYEFFDFYKPAKYLGGDYFDYIPFPDGRLGIVLGDVAGKGISAALLMAKLSSEVRFSLLTESRLPDAMSRLNQVYCDPQLENRFITVAMAVIDPVRHELRLVNAGHVYPIRRSADGTLEEIGTGRQGFPIGIVPEAEYEEITLSIKPGESVLFMSDGITDAMNAAGEYFELERVQKSLSISEPLSPAEIGRRLMEDVHQFVGATPQSDDQCLVIFGRRPLA